MSICGAAQWIILSDIWSKFKFFDFQKILTSTWEEKKSSQVKENKAFYGRWGGFVFGKGKENRTLLVAARWKV